MENGRTILLVEDEALIALAEKMILEREGYRVLTAADGASAVETAASGSGVDLVLMDIDLGPGMSGTDAAAQILRQRDVPIVFLSSHIEPAVVKQTEGIGSYGYIVKNSGETVLLASIRMAFRLFEAHEELKRQKERLRTSEERFEKTFALIPDMVSIHDREMNILYSNWRGFADVPEEKREPGGKCYRVYRGFDDICPDCRAGQVLATGETYASEISLPDGRWVDLRMIPLLNGDHRVEMFVEWVRDISDRKNIETDLRRSERQFRTIMDAMRDVVFTLDTEGRHTGVYGRWVADYGMTEEAFLGKTFSHILGKEAAAVHQEAFRKAVSGTFTVYNWTSPAAGGEEPRQFQTSLSPITGEDGKVTGVVGVGRDISDLMHIREMEGCMESAPYAIFIADNSGRYLEVNPAACELSGRSREELLSMSIPDMFPPDLRGQAQDHFRRLKEEGASDGEVLFRNPRGEERWWYITARPVSETKLIAFCSDITQRKEAEQALMESENRFHTVLRDIPNIAVQGYDRNFLVRYWNRASETLYGYSAGEALGKSLLDLIIPRSMREEVSREIITMFETGKVIPPGELNLKKKNGTPVPVLSSHSLVRAPDGEPELFCLDVDLTQRKKAESELTRQLEENKLLLRETLHRIKNNMGSIESLLRLQADSAGSAETREALQETLGRVESMSSLYEKLLLSESGSTVEAGLYLGDIADSVVALFAGDTDVRVTKEFGPLLLPAKTLFPLGLILNEILVNAMKYAFAGREEGRIRISAGARMGAFHLSVEDDGKGLPPDFSLESSTGFGLMLVKMLCDQLGAALSVSSAGGTKVELEFGLSGNVNASA